MQYEIAGQSKLLHVLLLLLLRLLLLQIVIITIKGYKDKRRNTISKNKKNNAKNKTSTVTGKPV